MGLSAPRPDASPSPGATQSAANGLFRDTPDSQTRRDGQPASPNPGNTAMPSITPGQLAFSAMQFLPVPLLVLSSLKTVVLANEAMGRLLGIIPDETEGGAATTSDHLRGHGLSQVGVDMVQDGRPVWINWERFLDSLVSEKTNLQRGEENQSVSDKDPDAPETANTPGAPEPQTVQGSDHGSKAPAIEHPGNTAVVEVIISRKDIRKSSSNSKVQMKTAASQRRAKMIITIFEVENHQAYFTLTFTNTDSDSQSTLYPISRHSVTRTSLMETAKGASISSSDTSLDSLLDAVSPSAVSMSTNPFPPHGPPVEGPVSGVPSILQKIIVMKDALIDHTETPIVAMWKDGSAMFPNQAARKLFDQQSDLDGSVNGFELLGGWKLWNEDFTAQLELSGFPMSVLLRTETPFTGRRVGIYDSDGNKRVLEAEGELIRDELSGEVLAGVVTFRDVTKIAQMITRIKEEDEERFKTMCDAMPQLVFTTTPEGHLEFYNKRWYEYTGLTVAASVGEGWMRAVHPEDVEESNRLFQHSLRTGEPFMTEYRCQSKEGEWKWFITRALPLRSKENGEILKWYGTCTDANEHILSRHEAKRTRQQLLTVIAHARVTIFQVDIHRRITMLEGALIEDALGAHDWYIGQDVHHVFSQLTSEAEHQQRRKFLEPIDTIIAGHQDITVQVDEIGSRFYRTRFLPIGKKGQEGQSQGTDIEGVIGVIMDITELKAKEADIETQAREKQRLMASEAAAKEASKLKSQFLANMSHEIRTPITGVIGMAELMLDLELDEEQREFTENIYRSANALLTVINDILDFSKVESGRLDIEEVQFSLSIIVRDVKKMFSFAAQRKNLDFSTDISPDIEKDLVVIGDPGRVRQIITNLLTNSVKFTNQGYVKLSVMKEKETDDMVEIRFVIEDTGIGIEQDVRKRLFQPFSQGDPSTARKFGGTGLGLTICKSLLELMHGRMTLDSVIGSGTTATFWIPFNKSRISGMDLVSIDPLSDRFQADMKSVSGTSGSDYDSLLSNLPPEIVGSGLMDGLKTIRSRSKHPSGIHKVSTSGGEGLGPADRSEIHVLVVEDNAINQKIAMKTIAKIGFTVTAVWNGREALDYLVEAQQGNKKKPGIILMDVQMPVIDGYKCTHLLRYHHPYKTYVQDVPIVAMTASAIQGDREKCKKAGMDDYLAKPVRSKVLEKMLLRWARQRPIQNTAPSSQTQGSEDSECSNAGEHCDNADIPGVEHDDNDFMDLRQGRPIITDSPQFLQPPAQAQPTITMTKPPLTRSITEETEVVRRTLERSDSALSAQTTKQVMRTNSSQTVKRTTWQETDGELAAQSRDDKLFDAAGARTGTGQGHLSHQLPHSLEPSEAWGGGEALTEANMVMHDKEEADKLAPP